MDTENDSNTSSGMQYPALLMAEAYFLEQENVQLKEKLVRGEKALSFEGVKTYGSRLLYQYTGLPSAEHFMLLLRLLQRFDLNYHKGWIVRKLPLEDQLLCTLMKLRLNLASFDLAYRFKISVPTVHNIVIPIMYAIYVNKSSSEDSNL